MNRQRPSRGFVLLALIAAVAMVSIGLLLDRLEAGAVAQKRSQATVDALSEAKAAIIAWSVVQATPGKLPCPEDTARIGTATEGQAMSSCNSLPAIGRLPWRTLGTGPLRDGDGETLWYALSPGFRASVINSATPAGLHLDNDSDVVALVFAAGPPLPGQHRAPLTATQPPVVTNYLEGGNQDGNASFVTLSLDSALNDKVLAIRHADLFGLVIKRVIRELRGDSANGLIRYNLSNHDLPPSGTGNQLYANPDMQYPGSAWLHSNGWFDQFQYQRIDANNALISIYGISSAVTVP